MKKQDNESEEDEKNIIENVKEIIVEKKDNGGEILEIKEDIKEKTETEIPQIISESNEIIEEFRNKNLNISEKDPKQRGPCQKCQCLIF